MEPLRAALAEAILPHCGRGARALAPDLAPDTPRGAAGSPPPQRFATELRLTPGQWRGIGRDVLALHEGYTQRSAQFAHQANPIHSRLAAYQLYYLPRNWYRVHRVLEELPWAGAAQGLHAGIPAAWLERDPYTAAGAPSDALHVLDLGCGTGAFSLAWLSRLAQLRDPTRPLAVRLTLVDQGRELLELAWANLHAFARRALPGLTLHCETHADGVQAFLAERSHQYTYAVAGAAMTLNELALLGPRRVSSRADGLVGALTSLLKPGGVLLFVEPGTRRGFMNLMTLRELLLHWPMLYPCPHNLTCPMWDGPVRHWCHATERLPPGFFFDDLLRRHAGLEFDMRDLQLAALAVQAMPARSSTAPFHPRFGERIVSAPMRVRAPGSGKHGHTDGGKDGGKDGGTVSGTQRGNGKRGKHGKRGQRGKHGGPDGVPDGVPDAVPDGARDAAPTSAATAAAAAAAAGTRVVLTCAPDGALHERAAPSGGPYTRGRWRAGRGGPGS